MERFVGLLAATVLCAGVPAAQTTWVVQDGESIQDAIDAASNGDRVLVEPGVYGGITFLGKAIEVRSTGGPLVTTIDGANHGVVLAQAEGRSSVLQGFTVAAVNTGIRGWSDNIPATAGITLRDLIVRDCGSTGVRGNHLLERCVIVGNRSNFDTTNGGGLLGRVTMRHCVVADNHSPNGGGGGLWALFGRSVVEDCVFVGNTAKEFVDPVDSAVTSGTGAAIFGGVDVRRSVFLGNREVGLTLASEGGAIYSDAFHGQGGTIEDCTFLENDADEGGAVHGPFTIVNTICRDSGTTPLAGGAVATYSNVEGGYPGVGNFDADPLFVDALDRDFHLTVESPCLNAGDPLRLDPDGTRSDVGAFFFQRLYSRANTRPASWVAPSWPEASALLGGTESWRLVAGPALAGESCLVIGTLSGTSPGFTLNGVFVPLVPDLYTRLTLRNPAAPIFSGFVGTLDPGRAGRRGALAAPFDRRAPRSVDPPPRRGRPAGGPARGGDECGGVRARALRLSAATPPGAARAPGRHAARSPAVACRAWRADPRAPAGARRRAPDRPGRRGTSRAERFESPSSVRERSPRRGSPPRGVPGPPGPGSGSRPGRRRLVGVIEPALQVADQDRRGANLAALAAPVVVGIERRGEWSAAGVHAQRGLAQMGVELPAQRRGGLDQRLLPVAIASDAVALALHVRRAVEGGLQAARCEQPLASVGGEQGGQAHDSRLKRPSATADQSSAARRRTSSVGLGRGASATSRGARPPWVRPCRSP